jgi:hypothetical protein
MITCILTYNRLPEADPSKEKGARVKQSTVNGQLKTENVAIDAF